MESQPQNPDFRNNPGNFHPCIYDDYLLIISRNVKVTIRLVPQLNTVAMAIARPLTAAGNISLRTNQVTKNTKYLNV